jgi:hypothetical protein
MKDKDYSNEKENEYCDSKHWRYHRHYNRAGAGGGGAVYGLGFIGAAIFFIGKTTTFWVAVLGFLKAIVWPAYLVYEALKFLIK